jgi:hypothetical protein
MIVEMIIVVYPVQVLESRRSISMTSNGGWKNFAIGRGRFSSSNTLLMFSVGVVPFQQTQQLQDLLSFYRWVVLQAGDALVRGRCQRGGVVHDEASSGPPNSAKRQGAGSPQGMAGSASALAEPGKSGDREIFLAEN